VGEILVKNWIYKEHNTELIDEISKEFNISTLLATVINNRGLHNFSEIQAFLNKDLSCIHDPFLLRDADKAVERIQRAIENNETITIYGDYDVDGVTSIAIIAKYLSSLGAKLKCYIPDRMKEGYGFNC
jgi:single-stranded-DNA-specific exonuclease